MEAGLSGQPTECRYCDTLHIRDIAKATTFSLSMGYNFLCMISSYTLFDLEVGFRGQAIYLFIYIIKSYAIYTVNDKKERKDKDKNKKKNSTQFT